MNPFVFFFGYIGFIAAIFIFAWVLMKIIEFGWEVRRTLRECRDALRRLEDRRKESL